MPRHPSHLPAEKLKLNSVCFLAETFGALFILKILSYYTELKFSPRAKRNFLHPYKPPFQRQICRLNPLLVGWSNVIFIFPEFFNFPFHLSLENKQTGKTHKFIFGVNRMLWTVPALVPPPGVHNTCWQLLISKLPVWIEDKPYLKYHRSLSDPR